jgi:hypothetical protein
MSWLAMLARRSTDRVRLMTKARIGVVISGTQTGGIEVATTQFSDRRIVEWS